jgi:hypothetical protein
MAGGWSQRIQDRYRVDRELAQRGHVSSWLVTDLKTVSPCVLKVLREAEAPPSERSLFEAQARILGGLGHPGLPRLVEYFVEGEGSEREHVLITRYHPGESLDLLIAKGRFLTEAQALALLRRLVAVLAYLHGLQPPLVHRGLRPANVIIGPDGRPCLTDLNFAVEGERGKAWAETPPDATDAPLAAPEAAHGGAVPASDVYALGLVMLYAMSGQDPVAIAREGRQRIREATRAGEAFATILARMVEPSLERRYPDARALEADLTRLGTGRGPAPMPQPPPVPAPPAVLSPAPGGLPEEPRRGNHLRLAGLAVLLLAALAVLWLTRARREEPSRETLLPPPAATSPVAPVREVAPAQVPPPAPVPASAPAPEPTEVASAPAGGASQAPAPGGEAAAPAPQAPAAAPPPAEQPAPPQNAIAAAAPVVAEGRLLFDGQPVTRITSVQPTFWFRNEAKGSAEKPQVEYKEGFFRIRGLPGGRMGMSARINLAPETPNLYPGDLDAWTTFVVGEGPPPALDVNLRKVIHLTQPVDNGAVIRGWDTPCGAGSVHPTRVLFAWEPLDPAAKYEVSIERLACGRNYAPAGRAFAVSTAETWAQVDLEPSAEGECYSFRLTARKDGRTLGMLTTHGRDGMGWDYRFTVW